VVSILELGKTKSCLLEPRAPYNFDANFHKPSHFPSSNNSWKSGTYWATMLWQGKILGFKFEDKGNIVSPRIRMTLFSRGDLFTNELFQSLEQEIAWRFNFNQDISRFCSENMKDEFLRDPINRWRGMKPIAGNSLYEMLMIYIVLQNATVRRSVQMLENLFNKFGRRVSFDGQTLSTFWQPRAIVGSNEDELRALKVGYRAKSIMRISEQFVEGMVDEFALRKMSYEDVKRELDKLYGIGPASVGGMLFELFYFLNGLQTIPPWEQKIMSRLLFQRRLVATQRIVHFFRKHWRGYEKLAFHYLWEDLFWRRQNGERIDWLEKEIRL
jgi:3-methyladenine DNA glycosylase/8-oxoguanine DNA glycosylase